MKKLNKLISIILIGLVSVSIFGCSEKKQAETKQEEKKLVAGVAPGPYGDMVKKAIKPSLEKKGYKLEIKEFSDYVQPNLALGNKQIDFNLYQHSVYLDKFSKDNNLSLEAVISVPTASMGIFSSKVKSLDDLKDGGTIAIPNDAANLARALRFLQAVDLIKIKSDIDQAKASEKDIAENKKNFKFVPVEAAQLPRSLESSDIAVINGNYAISAGLKLSDALKKEVLDENYKNVIAIRKEDKNKDFVKDIKSIVESKEFKDVIESKIDIFKDFDKPKWYLEK